VNCVFRDFNLTKREGYAAFASALDLECLALLVVSHFLQGFEVSSRVRFQLRSCDWFVECDGGAVSEDHYAAAGDSERLGCFFW